jgi:hypothetical protein
MELLLAVTVLAAIGPGVALLSYAFWTIGKDSIGSRWPVVEGQVRSIRRKSGYRGIRHLQLTYEYEVEGKRYVGNRYSFGWPAGRAGDTDLNAFVRTHPEGSGIKLFYNPKKPQQALVAPGLSLGHCVQLLVSLAFLWMGLLVLHR